MQERARNLRYVAAATVLGWILFDLAVVAVSPEPLLVRKLLLPSALALALAATVGVVWDLYPLSLKLTFGVAAMLSLLSLALAGKVPQTWVWLPHVFLLLMLSSAIAGWAAARLRVSAGAAGCLLGMAGAAAVAVYFGNRTSLSWMLIGFTVVGMASNRLPWRPVRRIVVAAAVIVPVFNVVIMAQQKSRVLRPDRPGTRVQAAAGQPNLLFVVLDTVGANHLALYGYHRVTTPGIDAFVRRCATLYNEAYAASSWTLPAHASLFTGLYPSQHGAHYCRTKALCGAGVRQAVSADDTTLAERFAAVGYRTGAIIANAGNLNHQLGLDRGFEHYDDRWGLYRPSLFLPQFAGFLSHLAHTYYRSGETITDLALSWISADEDRPFFLFLNYMDAHGPYLPSSPHDQAFGEERPPNPYAPPRTLWALQYDRSLRSLDEHVTRLLHQIEERGLLDKTIVLITSDHGEAFGEHGSWGHATTLYGELTNVPLYVKGMGECHHDRSATPMTAIDVHRLALRAVGIEGQAPATMATRVIAEMHGSKRRDLEPSDGLMAWLDGKVKWIVSSTGAVEAYDLSVDPSELRSLAAASNGIERARAYARAWWTAHPPQVTARHDTENLDTETRDRMRALGY